MPSSSMLFATTVSALVATALAQGRKGTDATSIAVSGDIVVGIFFGFALIGMLVFAVTMLTSIEASDKLGQPKSA
jgi:hypothetical protein